MCSVEKIQFRSFMRNFTDIQICPYASCTQGISQRGIGITYLYIWGDAFLPKKALTRRPTLYTDLFLRCKPPATPVRTKCDFPDATLEFFLSEGVSHNCFLLPVKGTIIDCSAITQVTPNCVSFRKQGGIWLEQLSHYTHIFYNRKRKVRYVQEKLLEGQNDVI